MWAMTPFGILMPAVRPKHTIVLGDDRTMQIRTRRAKDLDILRARYMQGALGETLHTPDKDYEYRAYCTPHAFAVAMMQMILEIDYLKFKPTTVDQYQDHELHDCYNAIWSVVLRNLSTGKHQWEYWNTKGTLVGGKSPSSHTTSSPGWVGSNGSGSGIFDEAGDDGWSMDSLLQLPRGPVHRNSSVVRDAYQPDPTMEVVDLPDLDRVVDEDDLFLAEENRVLDALYAEIDSITHTKCAHPASDNARARCRRRRRRAETARLAEIRAAIDATIDEEAANTEDDGVLVGEIDGVTQ
jgi:hypothetical protein